MSKEYIQEVKTATAQRFADQWRFNFRSNREAIKRRPGVQALKNKFSGTPAILVGAGPSLDKNLRYLAQAKERAIFISSDAALKPLLRHGIEPEFVMALDPQEEIAKFLTGIPNNKLRLVAPTIVHPRILDLWEGDVVFYHKFAPDIPVLVQVQKEIPKVGVLTPGGSVLSVAYDLAFQIGSSPIIFVGQDLSYDKKNTYSRAGENEGQTLGGIFVKQSENIVYEKGIHGEILATLKSMSVSKQWFDWAFTTWKRPRPPEIFNCSEAGILTDHCRLMPFREVLLKHCVKKFNPTWILKKALR
tara:strand:- start:132 stop:1037 length:906 start_codon:yes stop_codon:yes gene_type:complete